MAEKQVSRPSKLKQGESTDVEGSTEGDDAPVGLGSLSISPEKTVDTGKVTAPDATTSGTEMKLPTPDETPSGTEVLPLLPAAPTEAPPPPPAAAAVPAPTTSGESPPKKSSKTSIAGAIRKMISPGKKEKSKKEESLSPKEKGKSGIMSRLESAFKSKSPPDKSIDAAIPEEDTTEGVKSPAQTAGEQETSPPGPGSSTPKKPHKKLGTKLKKSLSSVAGLFTGNKGSATAAVQDEVGLVVDPETPGIRTPEVLPVVKVVEAPSGSDTEVSEDDRQELEVPLEQLLVGSFGSLKGIRSSLTSQQESTLQTQLTDVQSSGSDVFLSDEASSNKDLPVDKSPSDKSDREADGSRDSDEKTSLKRQSDTPPEVFMQIEGTDTIASPFKKANISRPEQRPSEEAKDETPEPKEETSVKKTEDEMDRDP